MGLINNSLPMAIGNRPKSITASAGLLAFNTLVLIFWWFIDPNHIDNNGGEIFFIALWGCLAYASFNAWGWVRTTITGIWIAYIWGLLNTGNVLGGIATTNPADLLTKALGLIALVLLWLPAARTWSRNQVQERSEN